MILCDVNVLVYAYRRDLDAHTAAHAWLEKEVNGPRSYGWSDLVAGSFLRIVTNPRIFRRPSSVPKALAFVDLLRGRPNAVSVVPGPRHWSLFVDLCGERGVHGDVIPDAWLAALAIESGCEWITTDQGFARFPGLVWRNPL